MESESNEDKYIIGREEAVHVTADGNAIIEGSFMTNMSEQEARECIGEAEGVDPDAVGLRKSGDDAYRMPNGRRVSVGFSKWRSSWDPKGPKGDPNLN